MADTRESLFGPSPQDIAAAQAAQQQQDAFNWAKLPAGRGMVAAGAQAGQAFGRLGGSLLGGQDPAQAKAAMLQQAQRDTEMRAQAMGINLATSPQDYYKVAADTLHKYGLVDEAQNVMNIAQGHDLAEREMRFKEDSLSTKNADRFGMSGNIIYDKQSGTTKPVPGYQGKSGSLSTVGKIMNDFNSGVYGDPSSEEAVKLRNDAIAKAVGPDQLSLLAARQEDAIERLIKNDELATARQTKAQEAAATAQERAAVNRGLAEQIDNYSRAATADSELLQTLDTTLTTLEKSRFQPGFAYKLRQSAGEILSFAGYPELADSMKINPADAATLNAGLKKVIGDVSLASQGSGNNNLSSKELQLFSDSIGDNGTVEEGLYQTLKIIQKQKQYGNRVYEQSLKAAQEARQEANTAGDPTSADVIFRQKMYDWKKNNPSAFTKRDYEGIRNAASIMRKARDAKPIGTYQTSPTKWSGLKPGMLVVDDDGVVKVFSGQYQTFNPGIQEVDGQKYNFKQKTIVPILSEYK